MKAIPPADMEEGAMPVGKTRITRRGLLRAAGIAGVSAAALGVYGTAVEPQSLVVTRYAFTPPGWPAGFRRSLTVIADLHAGGPDMTFKHVRQVVDTANSLRSDIVLLLGDYITTHNWGSDPVTYDMWSGELARLTAPLGVWAILGNHDWRKDIKGIRAALAAVHIPVLENDAVLLGAAGERFWLAGLGDQLAIRLGHGNYRGVDDLPRTMAQINTRDPVLLLAHEPDIFTEVPARVSLTLSGHTHGGQVRLPFIWPAFVPSAYGARFAYGRVVEQDRNLIVSGGLGTSFLPARLGVPPEVVHVELGV